MMLLNIVEEMIASVNIYQSVINLDNNMKLSHSVSSLQSNSGNTYWDTNYLCSR